MEHIVVLLGTENSGKSNTIKKFMGWTGRKHTGARIFYINKKHTPVFVVNHGSPQELNPDSIANLIKDINHRLASSRWHTKFFSLTDFILLLPFTIRKRNGELNKEAILRPIKEFGIKNKFIIHLKGGATSYNQEAEEFISNNIGNLNTIKSEAKYSLQAKELEKIIKSFL